MNDKSNCIPLETKLDELDLEIPEIAFSSDEIKLDTSVFEENLMDASFPKDINLSPPLLTKPVTINLSCFVSKLLENGNLKENPKKRYEIFELITLEPEKNIILDEEMDVITNLPFLLFRLKYGISDRHYLFYTLSNEIYQSFKKQNKEVLLSGYLNLFKNTKEEVTLYSKCSAEKTDVEKYDFNAFLNDENNLDYINSVTLLNNFQCRLSEITGINELAFIQPNLLHFQPYLEINLKSAFEKIQFSSQLFSFSDFGGRVDYKANTHVGIKPLLLANTGLPYINSLKEIYWLNTSYYPSSGERLVPEENYCKVRYFTNENYWLPSLEDLMKITFADYLTFKTYRPNLLIPRTLANFPLTLFSTLYLIDFIGRGAKKIDIKETTAYSVLLYIVKNKKYIRDVKNNSNSFNQSKIKDIYRPDYSSPEEVTLNLHREQKLYSRSDDKVLLFTIPIDYHYYKVNPLDFVKYLESEYAALEDEYKTNDRKMYSMIFSQSLDRFINDYRTKNNFISYEKIDEIINSLCLINNVEKDILLSIYTIPDRMYLQELNQLLISINLVANTKNSIY